MMSQTPPTLRSLAYFIHTRRELDVALTAARGALDDPGVLDAVIELLSSTKPNFADALVAAQLLSERGCERSIDALAQATAHPLQKVRLAAAQHLGALASPDESLPWCVFTEQLLTDTSHHVRGALVDLLARAPGARSWDIVLASDDPHWRVRKQVIVALQARIDEVGYDATIARYREELDARGVMSSRAEGLIAYCKLYNHPPRSVGECAPAVEEHAVEPDLTKRWWWSSEPTLTRENLEKLTRAQVGEEAIWLAWVLGSPDERERRIIMRALPRVLTEASITSFLLMCSDPRRPALDETRARLLERVDHDRLEATAWFILEAYVTARALADVLGLHCAPPNSHRVTSWAIEWLGEHVTPSSELELSEIWPRALALALTSELPELIVAALRYASPSKPRVTDTSRFFDHHDARVVAGAIDAFADMLSDDELGRYVEHEHFSDPALSLALVRALEHRHIDEHFGAHARLAESRFARVRSAHARALRASIEAKVDVIEAAHALRARASVASVKVRRQLDQTIALLEAEGPSAFTQSMLKTYREDPSPRVRGAALDSAHAVMLLDDPSREPSWRVLQVAADIAGVRLSTRVPLEWTRWSAEDSSDVELERSPAVEATGWSGERGDISSEEGVGDWWQKRQLGSTRLRVSRVGVSGHYALPERGFARALERGVNTFFWEPIYLSQTRFFKPMSKQRKSELVMCCGTFEATPKGLRRDVEKALRAMELEQIQVFYVFWLRDMARLSDELREEMERLEKRGLVDTFGVSTHSRALARDLIEEWPAVMIRHNAAHTGAEREVLPYVDPQRCGITTFTNLCYGRMISELPAWTRGIPEPADAYRYTLSQSGVTSCWSAPSTLEQLEHNLTALDRGPMSEEELEELRSYGRALYRLNTGFNRFVRSK